jgi:hypothetical protein
MGYLLNTEMITAIDCVKEEIVFWKVRAWDASETPCIVWRSETKSEAEGKIGQIWDALKEGENFLDLTK